MVPNHGLIIHSLLHGEGDFSETMKIVNTCGWDTDCNSGNVGCLMGIMVGLDGIDAGLKKGLDWRGPVADRLYNPTADGDRSISDCVREATHLINMGHTLAGKEPYQPKDGAQFHFTFPGSVQGFQVQSGDAEVSNVNGGSLRIEGKSGARIGAPVFIPSKDVGEYFENRGYKLMASPRIFPGQTISAATDVPGASLYIAYYNTDDEVVHVDADGLTFDVPSLPGPIFEVGLRLNEDVSLELDRITWSGTPDVVFERPNYHSAMWRRAWVDAVDQLMSWWESFRLIQNQGLGLIAQGTREWIDYAVSADVTPHLVKRAGIAARVQGLRRFYALLVTQDKKVQLVRHFDQETVLAEAPFEWSLGETLNMTLNVKGDMITGLINDTQVLEASDAKLDAGAAGLLVEEGRTGTNKVKVGSAS
jgi:hypothetical protein